MNDLSEIWTAIDLMDERTFPPLKKRVLMAEKDGDRSGWYKFSAVNQRRFACANLGFTHWRGELKVDFP